MDAQEHTIQGSECESKRKFASAILLSSPPIIPLPLMPFFVSIKRKLMMKQELPILLLGTSQKNRLPHPYPTYVQHQ
ncbi:hypothetical protein M431DRAFT_511016 [Trichoderma harzianum CBS 226.95]|uniref:Uncharacterized protein n=1 Tax=Trichoderma harzianum CBS 226.95 TaxID=983964 RepID=A0A2T4A471_TRIHA|nr:hypothetical protein M431DRAFT_511016 [Trichoderma harzianum CBS 226.95]PTB51859.1 hypothetical protein M431DRAFT_511016 [Trichoderma harzianum CBS 226.95]